MIFQTDFQSPAQEGRNVDKTTPKGPSTSGILSLFSGASIF